MLAFGHTSIFEWVIFIWAIFSAILYILIMWMLYRKRHEQPFHNSFFKLFISLGIADLGSVLAHYPLRAFRYWGWITWEYFFENDNQTVFWFFALYEEGSMWFYGFSQYIGITLMAFNRLRSVVSPLEMWSTNILRLCYFCQWCPGFMAVIPMAFMSLKPEQRINGSITLYYVVNDDPLFGTVFSMVMLLFAWILIFVCSGLYIAVYMNIRKKNQDDQQVQKSAIRLAFMSSVLFVMMLGMNLYIIFVVLVDYDAAVITLLWTQWFVIFGMINPWLLLICSTPVRKKFITFITPVKYQSKVGCQATDLQHRQPEQQMIHRQPHNRMLKMATHK